MQYTYNICGWSIRSLYINAKFVTQIFIYLFYYRINDEDSVILNNIAGAYEHETIVISSAR